MSHPSSQSGIKKYKTTITRYVFFVIIFHIQISILIVVVVVITAAH